MAKESSPKDRGETSVPPVTVTDTGDAEADEGGTAVTGYSGPAPGPDSGSVDVSNTGNASATGNSIAVSGHIGELHMHQQPLQEPVAWPILVGTVPALASAFQERPGTRERIDRARAGVSTVVLTQVLSGGGGTGKSQLAASYARQALTDGTDLVVWAPATTADQIVGVYAKAAGLVRAPGAGGRDAEADAQAFLAWLATTSRSWLVVLDDVTDPAATASWWPPASAGGSGQVLATTRRRGAALTGSGRTLVEIDTYTPTEAVAYLTDRLDRAGFGYLLDGAESEIAEVLGRLPLALSHAAAYMINEDIPCRAYRDLFQQQGARLDDLLPQDADAEDYGRQVATALLLSLDAARDTNPATVPVLRIAALLDPAGHPHALWTTQTIQNHLDGADGQKAVRALHNYGLLTIQPPPPIGPRTVTLHALTAHATRDTTPSAERPGTCLTAADALLELWPDPDHTDRALAALLRANTTILTPHTGDHLWHPEGHPLLYRTGISLDAAGLYNTAINHWETLTHQAHRILGPDHPDTLSARNNLALSYWQAGRTNDAITLQEQVLTHSERLLGPDHPNTLTTRHNLALSYGQAGRTDDAITLQEQVLTHSERLLGPDHPNTLTTRHNLASSYWQAGRTDDAITLQEQVLTDRERLLGPDHPNTLTTRHNLASSYWQAGRTDEAILLLERVVADSERVLGPSHPYSVTAAEVLRAWREAGGGSGRSR
ncbi:tetratricopeptide repeat protein [Streptantibioticus silvisoli]|uniref:Tetratricopeptide repeat protein n=1 Tax=Streptantibioticus silvisoli TaxID=2705255 RepID=A0ABT6WAG2_9ACTN|nr:tetratricopeptide repeat protein [Streptantibioticus silvisoli]MDI5967026.1 tetratricopeptide repeat protein [Streptantibioticus silvisoli]